MKRVLVVSNNDLLLSGIERLLGKSNAYSIYKSVSFDEKEIIKQIQQSGMDVLIIEVNATHADTFPLLRLMNACENLRVLTLEVNSNQIQVYDKREIVLHESEDLVSLL